MKSFEIFISESIDYDAYKKIMGELEKFFDIFDKKLEEDDVQWHKDRYDAVKKFKDENRELARKNVWAYYEKLHSLSGGKGVYNLIQYGVNKDVESKIRKQARGAAEARRAKIAAGLQKLKVTEVNDMDYARSNDGFNGIFRVNTDTGLKIITINSIYAGGYNIQRGHIRVLVKVKDLKK